MSMLPSTPPSTPPSTSPFRHLGLIEPIDRALRTEGYAAPTPIQAAAIPRLLDGADLLGVAQTGTGKTATFALPILQRLQGKAPAGNAPKALILTPTRELAAQIVDRCQRYGRHLDVRSGLVVGGAPLPEQAAMLRQGVHVLVATPGRLLDLLRQRHLRLSGIEVFVLDEADRMLDMGFLRDVKAVIQRLPATRQSLLFSATMPDDIAELADRLLRDPIRVVMATATAAATVPEVEQRVYFVARDDKRALLADTLLDPAILKSLVFTRTKATANEVARYLRDLGVSAEAIHGNKSQDMREATLRSFRNSRIRVLVASDLAARGLDLKDISHVFNFDLPEVPETYVHRIGRTARAGRRGVAISFCEPTQGSRWRAIEALVRAPIEVIDDHPFGCHQPTRRPRPQQRRRRQRGRSS